MEYVVICRSPDLDPKSVLESYGAVIKHSFSRPDECSFLVECETDLIPIVQSFGSDWVIDKNHTYRLS